ncbi:glycerophosphoryl diester phosphodiesterase membrane domain-containing protein [Microbacterium sp. P02]|uniref:glycerophosphoryl diester phosphodiesterase membrane domain-containing protein n=1 Tax=Microbacterium sp. P02 TaxID=3366260 RepID=UPI00366CE162
MSAYPAWTPASRPGIIPLHPLTFGTILGRSFAALRHNPKVLLGFALGVQVLAYLLLIVGVGAAAWASFSRLDTLRVGTDDYNAVLAGSTVITAVSAFVLGLLAGALGVVVQGVVVSEVAHAALAERLPLRTLWRRVKPVFWRLIAYTLMLTLALVLVIGIVVGGIVAIGFAALPVAVGLSVLVLLAAIPLSLWLSTKLLLVPATIVLEHARIGEAVRRSWTLIRGRFWVALGVTVIISVVFGAISQVISIPFSFLTSGLSTVIAPTGDPEPSAIVAIIIGAVLTQVVTLLLQSVALVVQATVATLVYIDSRMRREGLDLDLLAYVERRDAGATGLPDPYREHVGRQIAPRAAVPAGPPYPYPAQGYGSYPSQGHAPAAQGHAPAPQGYAPPPQAYAPPPPQGYAPPPPQGYAPPAEGTLPPPPGDAPAPATPTEAPTTAAPPAWTPPGTAPADREAP